MGSNTDLVHAWSWRRPSCSFRGRVGRPWLPGGEHNSECWHVPTTGTLCPLNTRPTSRTAEDPFHGRNIRESPGLVLRATNEKAAI